MSAFERRLGNLEREAAPEVKTRYFFAGTAEEYAAVQAQIAAEQGAGTIRSGEPVMVICWEWDAPAALE